MFTLAGSCGWLPEKTILLIHSAYNIVRTVIPVLIVVMGTVDFVKSIASASDDTIRKNTNNFIQKLVGAAIAFIIPAAVNWLADVISDSNASASVQCMNQMLNGTYKQGDGLNVTDKPAVTDDPSILAKQDDQKNYAACMSSCMQGTKDYSTCTKNCNATQEDVDKAKICNACKDECKSTYEGIYASVVTQDTEYVTCDQERQQFQASDIAYWSCVDELSSEDKAHLGESSTNERVIDCNSKRVEAVAIAEKYGINYNSTTINCDSATGSEKNNCVDMIAFQGVCTEYAKTKADEQKTKSSDTDVAEYCIDTYCRNKC